MSRSTKNIFLVDRLILSSHTDHLSTRQKRYMVLCCCRASHPYYVPCHLAHSVSTCPNSTQGRQTPLLPKYKTSPQSRGVPPITFLPLLCPILHIPEYINVPTTLPGLIVATSRSHLVSHTAVHRHLPPFTSPGPLLSPLHLVPPSVCGDERLEHDRVA